MSITFRLAGEADLDLVLELMSEFYPLEHLTFDRRVAASAVRQLVDDPTLGGVYLIESDGQTAGYVVMGINFSLEFRGRYAWIDELYVHEPLRGRGIGAATLAFVESVCRDRGLAAVRLEVARANRGAGRLYRRHGFEEYNRDLLTRWIR